MPWIDDSDPGQAVHSRWKPKDGKFYRNSMVQIGPPIVGRQIVHADSTPIVSRVLDPRTGLQRPESLPIFKSLQGLKPDPFGLQGFWVNYSMNRRKRWTIPDILRNDIASLQDDSIALRRSAIEFSYPAHSDRVLFRAYNSFVTIERGPAEKYHTIIDGQEIHKSGKRGPAKHLIKPPGKRLPRGGKERREAFRRLGQGETDNINNKKATGDTKDWERPVHVMYRVAQPQLHKRLVNTQGTRKHGGNCCFYNRGVDVMRRCDFKRDCAHVVEEEVEMNGEGEQFAGEDTENVVQYCWELESTNALTDFVVSGRKKTKKKRQRNIRVNDEFNRWLSPSDQIEEAAAENAGGESEIPDDATAVVEMPWNVEAIAPLPFADVQITGEQLAILKQSIVDSDGSCHKCAIFPLTVCYHTPLPYEILRREFHGITAMRFLESGEIRIYFNEERGTSVRSSLDECVSPFSTNLVEKNHVIYDSLILPFKCMDEDLARRAAASDLVGNIDTQQLISINDTDIFDFSCCVCYAIDEDDGFALAACGHFACLQCWLTHVACSLNQGNIPIKCMCFDCDVTLDANSCHAFLPLAICRKYERQLAAKRRMRNDWLNCERCSRSLYLLKSANSTRSVVVCDCGAAYCARCRQAAHVPLSCAWNRKYAKLLQDNHLDTKVNNAEFHYVNVKRCPHCDNLLERSTGCNHMVCTCGLAFCYACMEPWTTGTHYNCTEEKNAHVTVLMTDVPKGFNYVLNKVTFYRCLEHRVARSDRRLRGLLNDVGAKYRPLLAALLDTYKETRQLMEYSLVLIAYEFGIRRNQRARRLRSLYRRCAFLVERFDQHLECREIEALNSVEQKMLNVLREMIMIAVLWV